MSSVTVQIPSKAFNDIFLPYLDDKHRYMVFYGGGGSGKSYFVVQRYIYKLLQNTMTNLLVVRAVAKTNRDSTFALFKQVIRKWNLSKYFRIYNGELRVKCLLTGNEVIFAGLDDVEKLKSTTFEKGELTDVWVEEASEILEADFNQLDIRLRGLGSDKQITLSFNPIDVNHWLKHKFFDQKNIDAVILHTTYRDNRFLDDAYKRLLESYKDTDRYYYDVYCLGMWGVTGKSIFNKAAINDRIVRLQKPVKVGRFEYKQEITQGIDGVSVEIKDVYWVDDVDGCTTIYKDIERYHPYVIGGDTAGEGSDFFVGQVLDNSTGEQVAVLRNQFDEDLYAHQMVCLGMYYNNALVGVESNFSTYPIREMQRVGYDNQYWRETVDSITQKVERRYGFKTTSSTRPVAIAGLVTFAREHIEKINDKITLEEMLTFVRNEKGKPEAQEGAHDDCVMALAIAHAIRDQQDYIVSIPLGAGRDDFGAYERKETNPMGYGQKQEVF